MYIHTCVCIYTYICIYLYLYLSLSIYIYIYLYLSLSIYIYICQYVSLSLHIYIYIYIHYSRLSRPLRPISVSCFAVLPLRSLYSISRFPFCRFSQRTVSTIMYSELRNSIWSEQHISVTWLQHMSAYSAVYMFIVFTPTRRGSTNNDIASRKTKFVFVECHVFVMHCKHPWSGPYGHVLRNVP